ncbi:MAG: hypothetical protein WA708_03950 [Acidobacteriaceae bacterium]
MNIKFFYIIVVFNLTLLSFYWNFRLPKYYLIALAYLWGSGFLEVALGPDRVSLYLKEVSGITLMSLYFYIFLRTSRRSVLELFDLYARAAFWISLLGIFISVGESIIFRHFVAVRSILSEPAAFATVVMPAFYYFASIKKTRKQKLYMYTIAAALLLSVSSTGMVGLLLSVALLLRRKSWGLFFAPIAVGILFFVTYASSMHFRARVDDTVQSASTLDVGKANLSTYALVSNAYVAVRAFQERPFFGYGVGGHLVAHQKYIEDLPGVESAGELENLNAPDANSMLLRTLSEFGLAGVCIIAFFIVRFWTSGNSIYSNVSTAIAVYFFMILLRAGQWFNSEIYFFVWIYVLVKKQDVRESTARSYRPVQTRLKQAANYARSGRVSREGAERSFEIVRHV